MSTAKHIHLALAASIAVSSSMPPSMAEPSTYQIAQGQTEVTKDAQAQADRLVESSDSKANKGDYQGALADADAAIKLDPKFAGAYTARAWAKHKLSDFIGAIVDCDESIKLDSTRAWPWSIRGQANFSLEDYSQAISDLSKAISISPGYGGTYVWDYYYRGRAYDTQNDNNNALKDYNKAINISPSYTELRWYRGMLYIRVKNFNAAKLDAQKYTELAPTSGDAYRLLGLAYESLSDRPNAIAAYKKAAENYKAQGIPDWSRYCLGFAAKLESAARSTISTAPIHVPQSKTSPSSIPSPTNKSARGLTAAGDK